MNRIVLGALLALMLAAVGLFWMEGRAEVEQAAPPPAPLPVPTPEVLPTADVAGLKGPALPEATELTREQRRFYLYDRNRDTIISRNEMLSSRADGFRKLDVDGNNLLTFEEWAVATVDRFEGADGDRDGELTPAEFATTAPKRKAKPRCQC
ncbi:hypothetical protein [Altericroceibacterium xinjiangense]|uniref:hypothetical protein n=1 Tax=Altericroceibacterium xinjiangense TaxID=762261 RepID=UPI000F7F9AC8|nr:hypothetical protein [Altericroceibacterium xinjiangense]